MADSDSDIEVLDDVAKFKFARKKPGVSLVPEEKDEFDLMVVDDDDDVILSIGSSAHSKGRSNGGSGHHCGKKRKEEDAKKDKKRTGSGRNYDAFVEEDDDVGSEVTDVIEDLNRDEDLESLPSISPPSPPEIRLSGGSSPVYDAAVETDRLPQADPTCNISLFDKDAAEVDDFFQEAGYSSLADYLADVEREKNSLFTGKSTATAPSTAGTSYSVCGTNAASSSSKPDKSSEQSKPKAGKPEIVGNNINKSKNVGSKSKEKAAKIKFPKPGNSNKENKASNFQQPLQPPPPTKAPSLPAKPTKPGDIFKMMVLQIAEDVMSDELAAKLIEKGVQYKIIESPVIPDSILFERNTSYKSVGMDNQVRDNVLTEMDSNIIIIFHIDKYLKLLHAELEDSSDTPDSEETLTEWIQRLQRRNQGTKLTFLIKGMDAYLKKVQRHVQKEYRDRVLNGDNPDNGKKKRKAAPKLGIQMSRTEIIGVLTGVQLHTGINYRYFENSTELSTLLYQYVKAVGEAPYKREKMNSTEFDWHAVADCVSGIPVDDDGKGMSSLWIAQLSQFPKVGQESALAIARVYASPKALYQAYRRCSSIEEGRDLLTNIQVTWGVGPLAKTRRLGPEASKKIYRFFTATDGERMVNT